MHPAFVHCHGSSRFWQLALEEHDDKQLYIARQNLSDLRNVYAVMTDILHKNISKVLTIHSMIRAS
jgi:Proteasome activator pa28 beta subunit